jgi:hypothetical protein
MRNFSALEWLRSEEWSMGNGQCPDCHGVPESWLGHPCYPRQEMIGHRAHCPRAAAIRELGGVPFMRATSMTGGAT